jgi:enoyl-CoA hydratase/carnithine racemase
MTAQFQYFDTELTYNDRILVVTINRPPVNAFIKESYEELCPIMDLEKRTLPFVLSSCVQKGDCFLLALI